MRFFAATPESSSSSCKSASGSSSKINKKKLYSFVEARKIARGLGFSNAQEFIDYDCPGAYQLPKNPQDVWANEWQGWDDWLGLPWEFTKGRAITRSMRLESEQEYLSYFQEKKHQDNPEQSRLPYRPDLYYKDEWISWDDWLGTKG